MGTSDSQTRWVFDRRGCVFEGTLFQVGSQGIKYQQLPFILLTSVWESVTSLGHGSCVFVEGSLFGLVSGKTPRETPHL